MSKSKSKSKVKTFHPSKEFFECGKASLDRVAELRSQYEQLVTEGFDLYGRAMELFDRANNVYESAYDELEVHRKGVSDELKHFLDDNEDKLTRRKYVEIEEKFEDYGIPIEFREPELPSEDYTSVDDTSDCFDRLVDDFESLPLWRTS